MKKFMKPKTRQRILKSLNILIVFVLIFSVLPPSIAQAATSRSSVLTDGNCVPTVTGGASTSIFLPIVSAQNGLAKVASIFRDPQIVPRVVTWESAKTYIYDYKVEVNSSSYKRDTEGTTQSNPSKTIVQGIAEIAITNVDADGLATGQVTLIDPFVCTTDATNGQEAVGGDPEVTAALATPIIFQQSTDGVITSVQLPANGDTIATNVLKGIVNALQLNLKADSNEYTVEESGGQGTYNAKYTLTEDGDNLNIARTYDRGSFTDLNATGDEAESLTIDTQTNAVLDGDTGVLASVNTTEVMKTGDGIEEPDGSNAGFDGMTAWTEISSSVDLNFKSVSTTPEIQAASLTAPYVADDLGANFDDSGVQNPKGIDFDTLDLDAEIDALVNVPDNPEVFSRVIDVLEADEGTDELVINKIEEKLAANSTNGDAVATLIDVLAASGSQTAQNVLAGLVDSTQNVSAASIGATMSVTSTEHALISMVLVDTPTITTVNAVKNVSQLAGDLQSTAISVLGATADKMSRIDQQMADELTDELIAGLGNSETLADLDVYLGALGNTRQEGTVEVLSDYLTQTLTVGGEVVTDTLGIQFATYSSLGRIPGLASEELLIAGLGDDSQYLGTRLQIFELMSKRDDLSAAGLAALSENAGLGDVNTDDLHATGLNAPEIKYSKNWNRTFGYSKLGISLPGWFSGSGPPGKSKIDLMLLQRANANILGDTFNIATGLMMFWKPKDNYRFGVWLDLANYRIQRKYVKDFTQQVSAADSNSVSACNLGKKGTLWKFNKSLSRSFSVPVAGIIPVGVSVKVGASASLKWEITGNVCSASDLFARGSIGPNVNAYASADAYLSLWVVRGGIGVTATILDTTFDLGVAVRYQGRTRSCVEAIVTVKPLSGTIYAYADRRNWRWKWKRAWDGTLATFSVPNRTYPLLNRCYG